ncbi:hypothetical protein [Sphaerisporangium corydalis]|uniref:Uncharacterized protein n=1 Tax=Sphaerisporangium corydalis TaxID=1441875 RepID=A0ABV9ENZ1_9ACTN|nr:hypothetical protein [Sphaerisporangium corydalis]
MDADHSGDVEIRSLVPRRELTQGVEEWLIDGLTAALPDLEMARLFSVRRDMFREADLVTVATRTSDGSAVGALSSRWSVLPSGEPFLHVLTQFIGQRQQRTSTFPRSWGSHFAALQGSERGFPRLIVLKTYNPTVYCAMSAFTRVPGVTIYPQVPAPGGQDASQRRLAMQVARVVAGGHPFDPDSGIIRGIGVPPDLYPALPSSSNKAVNDYFAKVTSPGDRMLCLLTVPTAAAANAILSTFGVLPAARKVAVRGC